MSVDSPHKPRRIRLPSSHGIWSRLSRVGERLGWDWLTYNPGIFRHFHEAALRNAAPLASAVINEYPHARSLIDVGCGSGAFAAEFQRRGLSVVGFEYSPRGRAIAKSLGVDARPFNVATSDRPEPQGLRADLVMSTEVGEHIPAALADAFVRFIAACADDVVFTAADDPKPGNSRGVGEINTQPISYWIAKFEAIGFRHDAPRTQRLANAIQAAGASYYLHENLAVFTRSAPTR